MELEVITAALFVTIVMFDLVLLAVEALWITRNRRPARVVSPRRIGRLARGIGRLG
jgi:hypothetical protein